MQRDQIKTGHTYRTKGGRLHYVHHIDGQVVTYCEVGSIERKDTFLSAFVSRVAAEIPNQ